MKARKILGTALAVVSIVSTLTACGNNTQTNSTNENITQTVPITSIMQDNITSTNPASESTTPASQPKTTLIEMSSTGQITFDNLYFNPAIHSHIHSDSSGLLPFQYNYKYGYIDENGNVVIDSIYDSASIFSEGKALVEHGDKIEIIDTSGAVLHSFPRSDIEEDWRALCKNYFADGYLIVYTVNQNDILKIFDTNFNEIQYSDINGVYHGKTQDGIFGLIDYAGNILVEIPSWSAPLDKLYCSWYDNIEKIFFAKNGYANVCNKDDKWGLYDLNSNSLAIDYKYDYIGMYSDGVVPVASYSKWGLIDLDGNTLIPCNTYTYIGPFSNGRAFAAIDNNGYIIDKQGNILFTISADFLNDYYYISPFNEQNRFAIVETKKRLYVINDEGEILLDSEKFYIDHINEDYVVTDDKLYKFVVE